MYAMQGKLTAHAGKQEALAAILLRAAERVSQLTGCRMYLVGRQSDQPAAVCVVEVWDDKDAHDASLADPQVRALIAEAMPLICEPPQGYEIDVLGGHGLPG